MKQIILVVLGTMLMIPSILAKNPKFDPISAAMRTAIATQKTPSGVVMITRNNTPIYQKAFGHLMITPQKIRAKTSSFYDLASLTKLYTATLIMRLHDAEIIDVYKPVATYLKDFDTPDKQKITVAMLLTHYSGLPAGTPVSDYTKGATEAIKRIANTPLMAPPGNKFLYSDLGPIIAGYLAEQVTGKPFAKLLREYIFTPLGLHQTMTNPSIRFLQHVAAYDADETGKVIHGRVHDPRAQALGGLAGNAGIFATAADVAKFAQVFINNGKHRGTQFLSLASITAMTAPHPGQPENEQRGIGFDINTPLSTLRGNFSSRSFGHTGFTGTSLWIDPTTKTVIVILCNRLHPDGKGDVKELRRTVSLLAAKMAG